MECITWQVCCIRHLQGQTLTKGTWNVCIGSYLDEAFQFLSRLRFPFKWVTALCTLWSLEAPSEMYWWSPELSLEKSKLILSTIWACRNSECHFLQPAWLGFSFASWPSSCRVHVHCQHIHLLTALYFPYCEQVMLQMDNNLLPETTQILQQAHYQVVSFQQTYWSHGHKGQLG